MEQGESKTSETKKNKLKNKNEALSRNLPPDGYEGGLILDEMSIQSDLEFCSRDGNVYLWGFKEVTDKLKEY
jgi:hypothetical protein